MPSTYSTLFLSGQGLAGIFAALAMLMSMASEWTCMAGGVEWPLGYWGAESILGVRCLGFWVEMMGSWGLGLGVRSGALGFYSERMIR